MELQVPLVVHYVMPFSGKHCRRCYIVAIIMASILTVLLLSIAVYSGVATTLATSKTNGEIFMSANETYSIASGAQSVVLQRVRMEVNNSTTHWRLLQGRCDAVHQTKLKLHQHIEKNTTTNVGYLFYLLNGSKLSVTVQGSGNIKLYRERDASKVNQLEWRCINNEESWLSCDEVCNVTVDSAHYYVCSLPDEPMSFDIDIEKVQYNISEYEPCPVYYHNDEASIASECEMSQNLFHPECVFISASSDDVTYLSHAVGVTVTAVGRRDVTGSLAGAAAATALVVAITVVMFAMVRYRVRHQDKCMKGFQFDWFKNPDPN